MAAPVAAVAPQPAPVAAEPAAAAAPHAPATEAAPAVVAVEGAETAGIESNEIDAPAAPALETLGTGDTPVAGRASVADSGNTRAGDRRSEAVSGGGAEARPSATTPVTHAPTQEQGASDQRQSDQRGEAPRTVQPAAPAPTQRVDVPPVSVPTQSVTTSEPKGAATLSQAPRAMGQLIQLASQRGVQHARLNLKPVELGGIEIRLQTSSAGVTAQVVADSPEAARLLQQAGDDLQALARRLQRGAALARRLDLRPGAPRRQRRRAAASSSSTRPARGAPTASAAISAPARPTPTFPTPPPTRPSSSCRMACSSTSSPDPTRYGRTHLD